MDTEQPDSEPSFARTSELDRPENSRPMIGVDFSDAQTRPAAVLADKIDWIELALTLREPEIEILRLVYLPKPRTWLFPDVYHHFERLCYSERTARRKIAFLAGKKLLVRQYSGIGFVVPIEPRASEVQQMLAFLERRRQLPEFGQGITGELLRFLAEEQSKEEFK
jgi:hypothetical protein